MPQLIAFLVAAFVTVAYRRPAIESRLRPIEHRLHELLRRPLAGWLLAGLLALLVNWQLATYRGLPEPVIHDEFSYLLAADTFAHGRLTNPTHPLWRFFETFHVLQKPTYMSKYPPGHGLMLAAGQALSGEPILGVWFEAALLGFCAGYMLFGFLPAAASVLGAAFVALDPLVLQWSAQYWGGSLAAAGGCLVLGAWVRLFRTRHWRPGLVLGAGLSVLALTRPYEGLLFSVPFIAWTLSRPRAGVLAAAVVVACTGVWLMYDNVRVTGHALELPYTAYERQYALAPSFLWQPARPDHPFDRPVMQEQAQTVELPHYQLQRSLRGFLAEAFFKLTYLLEANRLLWISGLLLLWVPAAVSADRRLRWPLSAASLVLAGTLASNWTRTQYVAPALPVLLLIAMAALWHGMTRYPAVARGLLVGVLAGTLAQVVAVRLERPQRTVRGSLERMLLAEGGRHLFIVRYLPGHRLDDEWVYNAADIDASAVVWACDRGEAEDRRLVRYFAGRTVWLCTIDATRFRYKQVVPDTRPLPFPQ